MVRFAVTILGGGLMCMLLFSPAVSAPVKSGKQVEASTPQAAVVKVCTGCHGLEIVMDTPKDEQAWHDTVQEMIDRGAKGTPAEFDLVMQFLYENMTLIDINHADPDALSNALHASSAVVAAIVARRQVHPFSDLSDLEGTVPGLNKAVLDAKKRMIFFQ